MTRQFVHLTLGGFKATRDAWRQYVLSLICSIVTPSELLSFWTMPLPGELLFDLDVVWGPLLRVFLL